MLRFYFQLICAAAAYVVAAKFGLSLAPSNGFATLVWPAAGVALASTLLLGYAALPVIFIVATITNMGFHAPLWVAVGTAVGIVAETGVAVWLLRSIPSFNLRFDRQNNVMIFFVVAVALCPGLSAMIGLTTLWSAGFVDAATFPKYMLSWWLGDSIGVLIMAPTILLWSEGFRPRPITKFFSKKNLEVTGLAIVLIVMGTVIFFDIGVADETMYWLTQPYVIMPILVWSALRFEPRVSVTACFLMSAIGVSASFFDMGPFRGISTSENLLFVQSFIGLTSATTMIFAAVMAEHRFQLDFCKRIENDLRESRKRLGLTQIAGGVVSWDWSIETGKVRWFNSCEHLYGRNFGADQGFQDWLMTIDSEDREAVSKAIHISIVNGTPYEAEFRCVWPDGSKRWLCGRGQIFQNINGVPINMFGVNFDITDRKEAEEKLRQNIELLKFKEGELRLAKEKADSSNAAKTSFLANMSHEIRTPLGVVLGFSELLLDKDISAFDRARCAEAINRNGRLLLSIINDILDLSKIEADRLEVERRRVAISEIIRDMKSLLSLQAMEKGVALSIKLDEFLPLYVETDSLRLRQILLNIVGNAIKFTAKGTVTVSIFLREFPSGSRALSFVVEDTGVGMTTEQAERLFEIFTQADASTTRKFGGTGLGLALSRRLARALGGDVQLTKSEAGLGSVFTITIDAGPCISAVDLTGTLANGEHAEESLEGMRILLVEDVPDNRVLIAQMLSRAGAVVETAENGKEALERTLPLDYDVVLMDLQMPVMDGYETVRNLRQRGDRIPVIALSAHAMTQDYQRTLQSGFDDFLTKPIDTAALILRLRKFHGSQRSGYDLH